VAATISTAVSGMGSGQPRPVIMERLLRKLSDMNIRPTCVSISDIAQRFSRDASKTQILIRGQPMIPFVKIGICCRAILSSARQASGESFLQRIVARMPQAIR
jgi:hypothetical protein